MSNNRIVTVVIGLCSFLLGGGCILVPNPRGMDGEECVYNYECKSDRCYYIEGIGGRCGECLTDSECEGGGCTPPNPLVEDGAAVCNEGKAGEACGSTAVCDTGLVCGIVARLNDFELSACGECQSSADCGDLELCAPIVDIEAFSAMNVCIEPRSLENDSYCDMDTGPQACKSEICSPLSLGTLGVVGACGECLSSDDCGAGQDCVPAIFTNTALRGSICM